MKNLIAEIKLVLSPESKKAIKRLNDFYKDCKPLPPETKRIISQTDTTGMVGDGKSHDVVDFTLFD